MNLIERGAFERLVARLAPGSRLLRAWPLTGGVSAQVTALAFAAPGGAERTVVVRRYGPADLAANPRVAATEVAVLRHVHAAGLPVPQPFFADETGALFPTPYSVIDFIADAAELPRAAWPAALPQLAGFLAALHQLPVDALAATPLPDATADLSQRLRRRPAQLDESLSEGRVRAALDHAWPRLGPRPTALLHGDFWPGNTLWRAGQLAAVIDWEDALRGDPLADVATLRRELCWFVGPAAAAAFTQHYAQLAPVDPTALAVWDLAAALRPAGKVHTWGLPPEDEAALRAAHPGFVDQALRQLELLGK